MLETRKFILLVSLFHLAVSHSIPVTERNVPYPEWNETQFIEAIRNSKEMQKYLENSRNYEYVNNPTMDSYIVAYNLQHEEYQSNEEEMATKAKITKRSAPSTPQLIKFELSDAKEPDEATKEIIRRHREQRKLLENVQEDHPQPKHMRGNATRMTDRSGYRDSDQMSSETRTVKVFHGLKPVQQVEKLPLEVQKAIDRVLQEKAHYKELPRYGSAPASGKLLYSDKIPKLLAKAHEASLKAEQLLNHKAKQLQLIPYTASHLTPAQQYYSTIVPLAPLEHEIDQTAVIDPKPEPIATVEIQPPEAVEVVNIVPKLNYFLTEVPTVVETPVVHEPVSFHHVDEPKTAHLVYPQEVHVIKEAPPVIDFSSLGEYEKQIIKEHNLFQGENEISQPKALYPEGEADAYKELTALIGKTPTDQLQGLKFLLLKEYPQKQNEKQTASEEETKPRPQDNTAPILFHPPKDKQGVKQPNPSATKIPPIAKEHQPVTEAPQAHFYTPKAFTPVTEQVQDITEPSVQNELKHYVPVDNVHPHSPAPPPPPPPPPTSYNFVNAGGAEHNYDHFSPEAHGLTYASRYAFGYRVRDFHTGNDFGHTQNRDTDGITRGEYHILLPDGRVQNVRYHADDSGFHADVSYESL